MGHWFFYFVRDAEGNLSCGAAERVAEAIAEANAGGNPKLGRFVRPVFFVHAEEYMNEEDARRRVASVRRMKPENRERIVSLANLDRGF